MTGIPARHPGTPVIDRDSPGSSRENAVLAMPEPARTAEQRERAGQVQRVQEREAAVQVCSQAIREGCGGGRTQENPEGCTDPAHAIHACWVLEDLYELGFLTDPFSYDRPHFGKAPKGATG
jgi:hypothetical protein